jgi:hypothetical protein
MKRNQASIVYKPIRSLNKGDGEIAWKFAFMLMVSCVAEHTPTVGPQRLGQKRGIGLTYSHSYGRMML